MNRQQKFSLTNQTAENNSYSRHCEERSNPVSMAFFWIASPTTCLAMTKKRLIIPNEVRNLIGTVWSEDYSTFSLWDCSLHRAYIDRSLELGSIGTRAHLA